MRLIICRHGRQITSLDNDGEPEPKMPSESIFHKLVVHENSYTQLLCNLLERNAAFRNAILARLFTDEVANKISLALLNTQKTLADQHGRPDMFIETEDFCAIIEVKTEVGCTTTPYQAPATIVEGEMRGYAEFLRLCPVTQKWLVFLVPKEWKFGRVIQSSLDYLQNGMSNIHFQVVTWEDLFCEIKGPMLEDPFIAEFRLLLSKRFEPVSFSTKEVEMLLHSDALTAVWKLSKLIRSVSEKARSAGYSIKEETDYQGGSYGFYLMNGPTHRLYFGCWIEFTKVVDQPLCFGVEDNWGADLKARFLASTPYKTHSFIHPRAWTLACVPNELLTDSRDVAESIWEVVIPIATAIFNDGTVSAPIETTQPG